MEPARSPRVLVIGFDPHRIPGLRDSAPLAAAIQAGLDEFAVHGVGVETCLIGLDGADDTEPLITAALRSRAWECVVVGGGLRTSAEQLPLLEEVISLIRRHADTAAIAFNAGPSALYEAAARRLK